MQQASYVQQTSSAAATSSPLHVTSTAPTFAGLHVSTSIPLQHAWQAQPLLNAPMAAVPLLATPPGSAIATHPLGPTADADLRNYLARTKPPQFWTQRPEVRFTMLESRFARLNIT